MQRRDARLRKEYLYRKAQEASVAAKKDTHETIDDAFGSKASDRKALKGIDAGEVAKSFVFNEGLQVDIDDEYGLAGKVPPKVVITTSHDPSSRLQQFAKELRLVFPNAQRINRGNHVMGEIVQSCKKNNVTDLIVVHETRGVPVLRHEIPELAKKTVSQAYPHLIFSNFTSTLGSRITKVLKHLFPVPKDESRRVITFANDGDYISFRHHTYQKGSKEVELDELGPRFELRPFKIVRGTVDQADADVEWALKSFMNTSKKRSVL